MKITIYDNKYSFSEINEDEELTEMLRDVQSFDIPIALLTADNPIFGWLEMMYQSDIDLNFIDFDRAFIKFDKIYI